MAYHAYGFVDGAYLRKAAEANNEAFVNPRQLLELVVASKDIQSWCASRQTVSNVALARVIYYDGRPDNEIDVDENLKNYWNAVELLDDTELGFGSTRGGTRKKPPRQKGVDTLISVDMLVGAFTNIFAIAILVAGDADFVPVVNEVKRRGIMVVVVAEERTVSEDLKRAADRFYALKPGQTLTGWNY